MTRTYISMKTIHATNQIRHVSRGRASLLFEGIPQPSFIGYGPGIMVPQPLFSTFKLFLIFWQRKNKNLKLITQEPWRRLDRLAMVLLMLFLDFSSCSMIQNPIMGLILPGVSKEDLLSKHEAPCSWCKEPVPIHQKLVQMKHIQHHFLNLYSNLR